MVAASKESSKSLPNAKLPPVATTALPKAVAFTVPAAPSPKIKVPILLA